jgi:hypothetical protein
MRRKHEAWETEDGTAFFSSDNAASIHGNPAMKLVRKLFDLEAETGEEASSIYNLRMGFGPYIPMGEPEPCPKCGAWFYPQGSGECWRCGKIC